MRQLEAGARSSPLLYSSLMGNSLRNLFRIHATRRERSTMLQQADALFKNGQLEQAVIALRELLTVDPNNADAWYRHANALKDLNRFREALASYQRTTELEPRHTAALCNRGVVLLSLGGVEDALREFRLAIDIDPRDPIARYNQGLAEQTLKQPVAAIASFSKALELNPHYAEAYFSRGCLHQESARWHEALSDYERALALRPRIARANLHRGLVLARLERWDEALSSFDAALSEDSGNVLAHFYQGNVLRELHQLRAALASYERALILDPDFADAHFNRAVVFEMLKQFPQALQSFERAIAIRPGFVAAEYNRALLLLQTGQFDAGLEGYELRWKNRETGFDPATYHGITLSWSGNGSLEGKRILVFSEQGLGDTLQLCRYVKLLACLGAQVVLEVQPQLVGLLTKTEGAWMVIARGDPVPPCDTKCALMSLPHAFKTTVDTIPSGGKYVAADSATVSDWQRRLGPRVRPRIGLVWSGNIQYPNDHRRSIPLSTLIEHLPREFDYFCLQTEIRAKDRTILDANPFIANPADDLAGTAALCECLDLVISSCTSIAHLAGALGRPLWILLAYNADWRWLEDRDDSPWYPTAKLYRQTTSGDWSGVIARVASELRRTFPAAPRSA